MAEQGEQAVSVELSATGITCELLDGTTRFMGWDELQSVIVKRPTLAHLKKMSGGFWSGTMGKSPYRS